MENQDILKNIGVNREGNELNPVLAIGLCLYDVRFRVIRPDDYYTPMMYLPIERMRVEYKAGLTDEYMLCIPVGKELNIEPDYIRIEDFQPCC